MTGRRKQKPAAAPAAAAGPVEARRRFVTPEGVDLQLQVGAYVDRMLALGIDLAIIGGCLVGLTLLALAAAMVANDEAMLGPVAVIWLLGAFFLRVGYFISFELSGAGATPGKRAMKLRVISRDGRRLTADAVFARNAMRELEVFLPASFLLARGAGVDAGLILLGMIWTGVFILFPLFNRDRLRLGDLAAGAMVVKAPKLKLLNDVAQNAPSTLSGLSFSEAQLDAYGIKELQVLEDVLRGDDRRTVAAVAAQIRSKIDWTGPADVSDRSFLSAYYAALRGRLETGLLFGRRRADKHDAPTGARAQANT